MKPNKNNGSILSGATLGGYPYEGHYAFQILRSDPPEDPDHPDMPRVPEEYPYEFPEEDPFIKEPIEIPL